MADQLRSLARRVVTRPYAGTPRLGRARTPDNLPLATPMAQSIADDEPNQQLEHDNRPDPAPISRSHRTPEVPRPEMVPSPSEPAGRHRPADVNRVESPRIATAPSPLLAPRPTHAPVPAPNEAVATPARRRDPLDPDPVGTASAANHRVPGVARAATAAASPTRGPEPPRTRAVETAAPGPRAARVDPDPLPHVSPPVPARSSDSVSRPQEPVARPEPVTATVAPRLVVLPSPPPPEPTPRSIEVRIGRVEVVGPTPAAPPAPIRVEATRDPFLHDAAIRAWTDRSGQSV